MDRLTRTQIEKWRAICLSHWVGDETGRWLSHEENSRQANALCDLALSALSQEAVRDEVLAEVILVCDAYASEGDKTAKEYVHETVAELAARFRALKREPNAAGRAEAATRMGHDYQAALTSPNADEVPPR